MGTRPGTSKRYHRVAYFSILGTAYRLAASTRAVSTQNPDAGIERFTVRIVS